MIIRAFLIFLTLFNLVGCSNYNRDFECKAGKGLGCTPARKVHKILENGELKQKLQEKNNNKRSKENTLVPITHQILSNKLRVWLASQKDNDGRITDERYVELIIK